MDLERQSLTNYSILATTYGSDGKVWSFVVIQKAPRLRWSRLQSFMLTNVRFMETKRVSVN